MAYLRLGSFSQRMSICCFEVKWFQALVLILAFPLLMLNIGCGGTSSSISSPAKTLTAVAVSPNALSIATGATVQLAALGTYSDGSTADVTATVKWTAASTAVATVTPSGLVTAVGAGSTSISASLSGVSGKAALTVTAAVTPKTLSSIAVSPATTSIAAGATQQFNATATYSDGSTSNVSSTANWTVANASIATISSTGLATGVSGGSTTVTASVNGVSGTAALAVTPTVTPKTLSSIAITPATASIVVGSTQQYTATATYSDGSTANVSATATWATGSPAVATINTSGLALGVSGGSTPVTASLNGVTGTTSLTVTASVAPKSLTTIAITPSAPSIVAGTTQQFTATATYNDGSTANMTSTASWTVTNSAVATISSAGLATGVSSGSTTVTASLSGVNGTAVLAVTSNVVPVTLTNIAVTPSTASIVSGRTKQYTATGTYSDGSTANVTATAIWAATNTAIATVNSSGLATGVSTGSTTLTASIGSVSGTATMTVTPKTITTIAVSPNPASFAVGANQQFTATATYSDKSTADVTSTVNWTVSNTTVATIASSGLATGEAVGSTTATAALNGVSGSASLAVTLASGSETNITTWHVDTQRSGLNANEQSLTPSNITPSTFGKLFSYVVDGYVYGEPLLASNVTINGGTHSVVYVATEHDSVYAFDADSYGSGTPLWHVSLLQSGETPLTNGPIQPFEGVTSTPVIDLSTNTIYVVSSQKSASGSSFRLNALDITTGAHKFSSPVQILASVPATNSDAVNGIETLNTSCIQRAALLLANGNVYMGFGSCHSGWLLGYDAQSLQQIGVFNASPNLNGEGQYASAGGVWMGSGGPVADNAGNIYVVTGNGPWDGKTAFADSILKFNSTLQLQDYFTPQDYQYMDCNDADLAAGGLLMIPGTSQVLAGGKTGKLYLADTTNLGQEQANDAGATQTLWFEADVNPPYSSSCTDSSGTHTTNINSYEIFGTGAYFNGSVYLGITPTETNVAAGIRQFTYAGGKLTPGPYTTPNVQQNTRGTTPFISANGTSNGVLWMIDTGQPIQNSGSNTPTPATLRAYDATNFPTELYNSALNSGDTPGYGIKFSSPVVANGKAYISTGHDLNSVSNPRGEIDVYGLK